MEYRGWLESRIASCEELAKRHRGVGVYHDHLVQWKLTASVLREALAEFDRLRGANAPAALARAA